VYLRMNVRGIMTYCCLDTGCEVNLIPYDIVPGGHIEVGERPLIAANGTEMHVLGRYGVCGAIGDERFEIDGYVTDDVGEVILGAEWLTENAAKWDFDLGEIVLNGITHELYTKPENGRYKCRRVADSRENVGDNDKAFEPRVFANSSKRLGSVPLTGGRLESGTVIQWNRDSAQERKETKLEFMRIWRKLLIQRSMLLLMQPEPWMLWMILMNPLPSGHAEMEVRYVD